MLINAMAQPALLYLGEIPHPATGQPTVDLEGARIQIDMLDLLRVKCRGNLTPQEDNLLESVLHQLTDAIRRAVRIGRIAFVEPGFGLARTASTVARREPGANVRRRLESAIAAGWLALFAGVVVTVR